MNEEELRELKASLAKKPAKEKKKPEKGIALQYIYVVGGFIAGIFLLLVLFDKVIMPSMVHGRENVIVPEIEGLKYEKAKEKLYSYNLNAEISSSQFSKDHPKDIVLRQIPVKDTKVKEGRTIYLTISKGRDSVKVPYLTDQPVRKAFVILERRGLLLGDTTFQYSENISKGNVISQSIPVGKYVDFGTSVDIVVSKGSENWPTVPDLTGLTLDQAERKLFELALETGNIEYLKNDGTFMPYVVDSQDPPAGELVPPFTRVHLWVYKGN